MGRLLPNNMSSEGRPWLLHAAELGVGGGHLEVGADVHVLVADEAAPVPVRLPHEHHLLDGHVLGLRQEERDKDGHDDDPGAEEEEEDELEAAEHGEEGLRDDEGAEHVDGHVDALPRRADLQREDLAGHQPAEGAPGPGEAGHVGADEEHDDGGVPLGDLRDAGEAELGADEAAHDDLAREHLGAALQEQLAAAEAVDGDDGHEGGEDVDEARDDGGHEGGVVREAQRLEEDRGVEHDDVDARELLEHGDGDGHDELRAVARQQDVAPGVRHQLGLVAGGHQVAVLLLHVVGAPDALEHPLGGVGVAAVDEGVGCVGQEERAHGDDGRRHGREREADAPAPAAPDLGGAVVDEVGAEDADGDHELEADVEHPAEARRRHLREVDGHGLVGEADADAEEDAAEDEHAHVLGGAVERGADQERDAAAEHGPLAAGHAGDGGGEEGGHERRQVERGGEHGEQLAVELAVLVALVPLRLLLLAVHRREELHQERVHRRHATCSTTQHCTNTSATATYFLLCYLIEELFFFFWNGLGYIYIFSLSLT
uniref:Uncharacterized protein n=1 Tax=Zea mays TaxID=4577 RepID=A0A804UEG6_MAIZE